VLARGTRLQLRREHLERADGDGADLVDVASGVARWRAPPRRSIAGTTKGRRDPRPSGRLRMHGPGSVRWWAKWWAQPLHRVVVDRDGRPRRMRREGRF
jgi:hypothetical protein